jgi:hypothetical protein
MGIYGDTWDIMGIYYSNMLYTTGFMVSVRSGMSDRISNDYDIL